MQKMSDPPLKHCETCGAAVKRLVSLSSFSLQGGGWYKDLYSSTKPAASASEGGAAAKPEGSKAESSKSESPKAESPKVESPKVESKPASTPAA